MPTLSDFSSLFQLGAGVGLALSVFSEPIKHREEALRVRVSHQLSLIGGADPEIARTRRNDVLTALADLEEAAKDAKAMARWPMRVVVLGIVANFALLLGATICPGTEVSGGRSVTLVLASVGPSLVGFCALWCIASYKFAPVAQLLDTVLRQEDDVARR